jgi:hypothetical protein
MWGEGLPHLPPTTYHLPIPTYHLKPVLPYLPPTTYHLPIPTYHIPHTVSHLPTNYLSFQQNSRFKRVTTCVFYKIPASRWAAKSRSFVFIEIPESSLHFLKLLVFSFPAGGEILSTGTGSSPPTTYDIPPTDPHLPPTTYHLPIPTYHLRHTTYRFPLHLRLVYSPAAARFRPSLRCSVAAFSIGQTY